MIHTVWVIVYHRWDESFIDSIYATEEAAHAFLKTRYPYGTPKEYTVLEYEVHT